MAVGIPASKVHALAGAQNWRCCYCGFPMLSRGARAPEVDAIIGSGGKRWHRRRIIRMRGVTAEHIVPRCDGGTDAADNLVVADWFCNQFRGNQPHDFAAARIVRMLQRGTHPFQVWAVDRTFLGTCRLPQIQKPPRVAAPAHWPEIAL